MYKRALPLILVIILTGCAPSGKGLLTGGGSTHPITETKVTVTYGQVSDKDDCTCDDSQPIYLSNSDTVHQRTVTYIKTIRDGETGTTSSTQDNITSVPKQSSLQVGCTITSKKYSSTCKLFNDIPMPLRNERIENSIISSDGKSFRLGFADSCMSLCKSGSKECMDMGKYGRPLFKPLKEILSAAGTATNISSVRIAEVIGGGYPNTCSRGDVILNGSLFSNNGITSGEDCSVEIGTKFWNNPYEIIYANQLRGEVGTLTASTNFTPLSIGAIPNAIRFSDISNGVAIRFKDSDSPAQKLYGGALYEAVIVGDYGYAATINGCISGEAK